MVNATENGPLILWEKLCIQQFLVWQLAQKENLIQTC